MPVFGEGVRQFLDMHKAQFKVLPQSLVVSGVTGTGTPFEVIFQKDPPTRAYQVGTYMHRPNLPNNHVFVGHHRVPQTANGIVLGFERLLPRSSRGARLVSIKSNLARGKFTQNGQFTSVWGLRAENIRNGNARPANNLVYKNAIFYDPLEPHNAYYITVNANQGKVHQVYSLATLQKILNGPGNSPYTRRKFTSNNVARLKTRRKRSA